MSWKLLYFNVSTWTFMILNISAKLHSRSNNVPVDTNGISHRLKSLLRNANFKLLDQEEKAIRAWANFNQNQTEHVILKFPRAVHDCGLYANDCNYRGKGPEGATGSYMKQGRLQALAQLGRFPFAVSNL